MARSPSDIRGPATSYRQPLTRPARGGYLVFIVWSDVSSGALFCLALRAARCLRRSLLIGQLYLRDRGGNDGLAPGTLEQ